MMADRTPIRESILANIVFTAFNYQNTNFEQESWPAKIQILFYQKSQHLQKVRDYNQYNKRSQFNTEQPTQITISIFQQFIIQ